MNFVLKIRGLVKASILGSFPRASSEVKCHAENIFVFNGEKLSEEFGGPRLGVYSKIFLCPFARLMEKGEEMELICITLY